MEQVTKYKAEVQKEGFFGMTYGGLLRDYVSLIISNEMRRRSEEERARKLVNLSFGKRVILFLEEMFSEGYAPNPELEDRVKKEVGEKINSYLERYNLEVQRSNGSDYFVFKADSLKEAKAKREQIKASFEKLLEQYDVNRFFYLGEAVRTSSGNS